MNRLSSWARENAANFFEEPIVVMREGNDLARRFGRDVRMRVDESDDLVARTLECYAVPAIRESLAGRVSADHVTARLLRLSDYGLAVGRGADLVVMAAESVQEAYRTQPSRRAAVHDGRVVAERGHVA